MNCRLQTKGRSDPRTYLMDNFNQLSLLIDALKVQVGLTGSQPVTCSQLSGFVAQLVERCNGVEEVGGGGRGVIRIQLKPPEETVARA